MSGLVIICCDLRKGNNWFDIASKIAFCTKIEQGVNSLYIIHYSNMFYCLPDQPNMTTWLNQRCENIQK